jgi:hypothetical protein
MSDMLQEPLIKSMRRRYGVRCPYNHPSRAARLGTPGQRFSLLRPVAAGWALPAGKSKRVKPRTSKAVTGHRTPRREFT